MAQDFNKKLLMAPLQGLTDYRFRNVFAQYFQGIDICYSPFIRTNSNFDLKKSKISDVLPENNKALPVIPQILTKNADEFLFLAQKIADYGYTELNWNLGCPYPMVAKRGMGAGMLPTPERIGEVLSEVFAKSALEISVKIRSGYQSENEVFEAVKELNLLPIKELIIHPRTAKQMYGGTANPTIAKQVLAASKHPVAYNGDVFTLSDYNNINEEMPSLLGVMLGRGVLANPFLAQEIKGMDSPLGYEKNKVFHSFHAHLLKENAPFFSGDKPLLLKMQGYWEYFSWSFADPHKTLKRIKKQKSIQAYTKEVNLLFSSEELSI